MRVRAEHAAVLENLHVNGRLNREPAAGAIRRDRRRRNHQRHRGAARHRHGPADGVVAGRHRDAVLTSGHVVQHERRHTLGRAIEGDLRAGLIRSDLEPSAHRRRGRGQLHILRDDTPRFDGDGQRTRRRAARNLNVVGAWGKRHAQRRHPSQGAVNRDGGAVWKRLEVRGPGRGDRHQRRRRCSGRRRPGLPDDPARRRSHFRRHRPRQGASEAVIASECRGDRLRRPRDVVIRLRDGLHLGLERGDPAVVVGALLFGVHHRCRGVCRGLCFHDEWGRNGLSARPILCQGDNYSFRFHLGAHFLESFPFSRLLSDSRTNMCAVGYRVWTPAGTRIIRPDDEARLRASRSTHTVGRRPPRHRHDHHGARPHPRFLPLRIAAVLAGRPDENHAPRCFSRDGSRISARRCSCSSRAPARTWRRGAA